MCRQVIFLIVYHFNSDIDYYNLLFYLQTTFIVIAVIHIWIQPYQSELLNALDGVILLLMVLVVNINTCISEGFDSRGYCSGVSCISTALV